MNNCTIRASQGQIATVDKIDMDLADLTWQYHKPPNRETGYFRHSWREKETGKTKSKYLHVLILERKLGRRLDKNEESDHRDNDKLNNKRENLRIATPKTNGWNKPKGSKITKYKYKGICPGKNGKRYMAHISKDGKRYYSKTVDTELEAAIEYDKLAKRHHGEFASPNFAIE